MIKEEVQSSFKLIADDMKKLETDMSDVKRLAIECRFLDGIEKVDAAFKTFIRGANNMDLTLCNLAFHITELQIVAEQSLNPTRISTYLNAIKETESIEVFEQAFSYVACTKARYLQLMCAYYIFKNDPDRVGLEFEFFNREFIEIHDIYQTMIAEKLAYNKKEGKLK